MPAADAAQIIADFRRYSDLLHQALPPAPREFALTAETVSMAQVERGTVLVNAVARDDARRHPHVDRLIELAGRGVVGDIEFVDAAGHRRDVYRPLTIYAWLAAFRLLYEKLPQHEFGRWDEGLRPWCDLLESELGRISVSDAGTPAVRGGSAAEAAWTALALHVAGKVFVRDAWTDLASDTFGRLTRGQQPGGAFVVASSSEHPELAWYHELAILHATASYAVQAEDRGVARAVARSTAFVSAEIQPDHATAQPWGLFAFIWNAAARPLADGMLHAISLRPPERLDGVSLILLADALYCLRLFTDREPNS